VTNVNLYDDRMAPEVLFVCVHNAGRSQMAAALLDLPKPLTTDGVRAADVVITMGCGDACPIFPGKRYEDWALDDPAGANLEEVRRIRDDIAARVRRLLDEL
jgi:arsenate reductase (thioredoxin)